MCTLGLRNFSLVMFCCSFLAECGKSGAVREERSQERKAGYWRTSSRWESGDKRDCIIAV